MVKIEFQIKSKPNMNKKICLIEFLLTCLIILCDVQSRFNMTIVVRITCKKRCSPTFTFQLTLYFIKQNKKYNMLKAKLLNNN